MAEVQAGRLTPVRERSPRGVLAEDLRRHALEGEASEEASDYGHKFEVRGDLVGPVDRAQVVIVWIILEGEDYPRLVTAYPGGRP